MLTLAGVGFYSYKWLRCLAIPSERRRSNQSTFSFSVSNLIFGLSRVGISVNPGATGIRSVQSPHPTVESYYTIDGRKMNGRPVEKGLYIVNPTLTPLNNFS